jgi:hypothetical protein
MMVKCGSQIANSVVVVRELCGQRILPLPRPQLPDGDAVKALAQFGFSENIATLEVEVARAANEGRISSREGRNSENTRPTRFEDFADELARAYHATSQPRIP